MINSDENTRGYRDLERQVHSEILHVRPKCNCDATIAQHDYGRACYELERARRDTESTSSKVTP